MDVFLADKVFDLFWFFVFVFVWGEKRAKKTSTCQNKHNG